MDAHDVFYEEIVKSAATAQALTRAARWLTESPARTALVGAGAGAVHGALTAEDGVGAGALRGGLRGAAVGGTAGGLGRAYRDTRLLNPMLSGTAAIGETAKRLGAGVQRFGKRQIHGLTGAYAGEAAQIGLRSTGEAERRMNLEILRAMDKGRHTELSDKEIKKLVEKRRSLREWGRSGDKALEAGITSLPGVAKGLVTKPLATAKALGKDVLGGGGASTAAMGVGVPLAIAAPDLVRGDESAVGGRSMRQKLVGVGSGLAGGTLTAGMPIVPQLVGGVAVDTAASRLLGGSKQRLAKAQQEAGQQAILGAVTPGGV